MDRPVISKKEMKKLESGLRGLKVDVETSSIESESVSPSFPRPVLLDLRSLT